MSDPDWFYACAYNYTKTADSVWKIVMYKEVVDEHDGYCSGYEYNWESDEYENAKISGILLTRYLPKGDWKFTYEPFSVGRRGCFAVHDEQSGACDNEMRITLVSATKLME